MTSKHLIVCCDGTWQTQEQAYPTNIARIYQAFTAAADPRSIAFYDQGIGTENFFTKIFGGLFGFGFDKNTLQAYQFLCSNYTPGDTIHLFGFSRGAYTVRSVCGLIYKCGLLLTPSSKQINTAMKLYRNRSAAPDDPEAVNFRKLFAFPNEATGNRPFINFLGCWDTVGSLGIPDINPNSSFDQFVNKRYRFYDTKLSFIIKYARHAVAIDESRKVFNLTPMTLSSKAAATTDLKEIWFAGIHSCTGGGDQMSQPLADITMNWMVEEFEKVTSNDSPGIDFSLLPKKEQLQPGAPFESTFSNVYKKLGLITRDGPVSFDDVHWSVKSRLIIDNTYSPVTLNKFSSDILALRSKVPDVTTVRT